MTPIYERIRQDVVGAVEGVRVNAGYHFDAVVGEDFKALQTAADGTVLVVAEDPEPLDDSPTSHQDYHGVIHVVVVAVQSADDPTPVDQVVGRYESDVILALTRDGAHRRNGMAIDTEILPSTDVPFGDGTGGIRGRSVNAQVHFRTLRNNPYSQ